MDRLWNSLVIDGKVLMELGSYPFSQRYGWLQDKYGLSWQIIYAGKDNFTRKIVPALMFTGSVAGKAEEAANFYAEVFKNSTVTVHARYGKDEKPDKEGTVKYASLVLGGTELGVMDSAYDHKFGFNEAISFMVPCDSQEEIDYYWSKLSAVLESEQCGWLKDKYGVVWQITPTSMDRMMSQGTPEQIDRVTQAFLKMKKFDLATLQKAYEGK